MFASPTMELARCTICSAIPEHCHRELVSSMVSDYDVDYGGEGRGHDDVPPEVDRLETLIGGPDRHGNGIRRRALLRCPACHRLYRHEYVLQFIGARNESTASYDRVGVEAAVRCHAELASEVEDPAVQIVDSFAAIHWRESLTAEERESVDAARAASRIEAPVVERVDDHFVVRLWVVSRKRLICRIVTVRETGENLREDAVIAENLPVD